MSKQAFEGIWGDLRELNNDKLKYPSLFSGSLPSSQPPPPPPPSFPMMQAKLQIWTGEKYWKERRLRGFWNHNLLGQTRIDEE